jgi:Uma2 family endonuclease
MPPAVRARRGCLLARPPPLTTPYYPFYDGPHGSDCTVCATLLYFGYGVQAMIAKPKATIEDLYNVPENGKAEIVNGELVLMSPTGARPGRAASKIAASLDDHEEKHGGGYAFGDNVGFVVDLPNRLSFSPDAAWHTGGLGDNEMKFIQGAPALAVEVRSEGDYGPAAERAFRQKVRDYFAAGTQVVWDVDLQAEDVVKVYRAGTQDDPTVYRRGDLAEAEPAVPGWKFPVDKLFR